MDNFSKPQPTDVPSEEFKVPLIPIPSEELRDFADIFAMTSVCWQRLTKAFVKEQISEALSYAVAQRRFAERAQRELESTLIDEINEDELSDEEIDAAIAEVFDKVAASDEASRAYAWEERVGKLAVKLARFEQVGVLVYKDDVENQLFLQSLATISAFQIAGIPSSLNLSTWWDNTKLTKPALQHMTLEEAEKCAEVWLNKFQVGGPPVGGFHRDMSFPQTLALFGKNWKIRRSGSVPVFQITINTVAEFDRLFELLASIKKKSRKSRIREVYEAMGKPRYMAAPIAAGQAIVGLKPSVDSNISRYLRSQHQQVRRAYKENSSAIEKFLLRFEPCKTHPDDCLNEEHNGNIAIEE